MCLVQFEEKIVCDKSTDELWGRVSSLDDFTKYWHGTKHLSYTVNGGAIEADIVFAFGGSGHANIEIDNASRTLTITYVQGPFKGTQKIWVEKGFIASSWNVEFNGVYRLLGGWNEKHFRQGTTNALRRLCGEVTEA
ncbi:hypothetical protein B9Q04_04810 [Candidatus Marsarchaeota G2 archaeon BE_D]|uniref:SRPBCC domain-containing protein n=1 Tax=Candidatus Marsarchaeota G2 archaeon BE_D TaxID=1978158 RepID=A0A2R6CCI2_9ARCH|nr:MAG: hypothetical protein B9Q04_04810 [Candidatus Marsarchaeota G2 archaeon BE_D]